MLQAVSLLSEPTGKPHIYIYIYTYIYIYIYTYIYIYNTYILFKIMYLFIYFWLHRVFVAVCMLCLIAEHNLSSHGMQALDCRLISCGMWTLLPHVMWNLPRPGIEPVSPALAGRFLTTEPPGKSYKFFFRFFPLILQNIVYTSLCYTVDLCWLSILYIAVCIC